MPHAFLWWDWWVIPTNQCTAEIRLFPPTEGCHLEKGARTNSISAHQSSKIHITGSVEHLSGECWVGEEQWWLQLFQPHCVCWEGCNQRTRKQEMQTAPPLYVFKEIRVKLSIFPWRSRNWSMTNGEQFEQMFFYSCWLPKWLTLWECFQMYCMPGFEDRRGEDKVPS